MRGKFSSVCQTGALWEPECVAVFLEILEAAIREGFWPRGA